MTCLYQVYALQEYSWDITCLEGYVTGTEQTHEVFSMYIPGLRYRWSYTMYIPGIYHAYTLWMYMTGIWQWYDRYKLGIWLSYTFLMHMTGIWQGYDRYILGIWLSYTWRLVLRRRTWPHSSRSTRNNITRSGQNCHLLISRAMASFGHALVNTASA